MAEYRGGGIAPGGGFNVAAFNLRNTIVAGNSVGTSGNYPDFQGTLNTSGYNLIGDTKGGAGFVATDILNKSAKLGPLQDNGGAIPRNGAVEQKPGHQCRRPQYDWASSL